MVSIISCTLKLNLLTMADTDRFPMTNNLKLTLNNDTYELIEYESEVNNITGTETIFFCYSYEVLKWACVFSARDLTMTTYDSYVTTNNIN
jgi:hypothetical protein